MKLKIYIFLLILIVPTIAAYRPISRRIKQVIRFPNLITNINTLKSKNDLLNSTLLPIIATFKNIPDYFKVRSLKSGMEYLIKYGYLNKAVNLEVVKDLLKLKKSFTLFQDYFGINKTGLFDDETIKWMNKDRCGMPDIHSNSNKAFLNIRSKRYALFNTFYGKNHLTWSISKFSKKSPLRNKNQEIVEVANKAFKVWENVSKLKFRYVQKVDQNTDIIIYFFSLRHGSIFETPFDGPNGTLAHSSYPTETDIHIDDDENFSLYHQNNHIGLYNVLIHEIGHKIGLRHSKLKEAIMYPLYEPNLYNLGDDDIKAIQAAYGKKDDVDDVDINDNNFKVNVEEEKNVNYFDGLGPFKISEYIPNVNLDNNDYLNIIQSIRCRNLKISGGTCLQNDYCILILGKNIFWLNSKGKAVFKEPEPVDYVFKGVNGKIDTIFRDGHLIHIIQGRQVKTFDQLYNYPISIQTINNLLPKLNPRTKIRTIFKSNNRNVLNIYSDIFYWNYDRENSLLLPKVLTWWGLPPKLHASLSFKSGLVIFIKSPYYWIYNENVDIMLSYKPSKLSDLGICV